MREVDITRKLLQSCVLQGLKIKKSCAQTYGKVKKPFNKCHPVFGSFSALQRLKRRHCFLRDALDEPLANCPLSEDLPRGTATNFETWRMLNRIQTGVVPVITNLIRWGLFEQNVSASGVLKQSLTVLNLKHWTWLIIGSRNLFRTRKIKVIQKLNVPNSLICCFCKLWKLS